MDVLWPELVGYGNLVCEGSNACQYVEFPIPPTNIPLVINCDSTSECERAVIYCPLYASCTINCNQYNSCSWHTNVYCPLNASCTIICSYSNSCKYVESSISSTYFSY